MQAKDNPADLVIFEDDGSTNTVLLPVDARRLTTDYEQLIERRKQVAEDLEKEAGDIDVLEKLVKSSASEDDKERPPLRRVDVRGKVVPSGPRHELAKRQEAQARRQEVLALLDREIATKRRAIEAQAARVNNSMSARGAKLRPDLESVAREAIAAAERAQRHALELGAALRDVAEAERIIAALANTERARTAFSIKALKERMALAFTRANAFELDPSSLGLRGEQVFIKLVGVDPTSPWLDLSFDEIEERHCAALIAEICRGA